MKKIVLYFIVIMGFLSVHAQAYKSAFRADVCSCLEEESLKRPLTENAFKTCLRETLPTYADQIDASIIEADPQQKYLKGQLARKELLLAMPAELIYTCDVYYKHIDYQRTSKKLIARENAKESELERYDQMVALTPTAMAYYMRAQVQFKLGNLKETEADIKKSLELNPNKENFKSTRHELKLLAWVYEEQERYTDAIALYDKIYFGELDLEVLKLRALADKKSGGTIANMPSAQALDESNKQAQAQIIKERQDRLNKDVLKRTNTNASRTSSNTSEKKTDSAALKKLFKL
ncbi:hypothetical protein HNV08_07085 [Winogradskyella eckloniae]|uniref:hypothetical protein n=1 Tax=Winogradskyella eckloniae TaxID=1089306 RepID=UPI00156512AF|nr:hypothetical protein [Winogradskyella eckloniae]NRD19809.1 hypothetical protein [Winogradskyella eckloniae]